MFTNYQQCDFQHLKQDVGLNGVPSVTLPV